AGARPDPGRPGGLLRGDAHGGRHLRRPQGRGAMSSIPPAGARKGASTGAAGMGLLAPDSTEKNTDLVRARAYRHPALGEAVGVRLCPDALAQGDDLTMDVLGFGPPELRSGLARQRRRALGFPAWPLIHDPARARYALEVVQEFRTETRKARSK